MPDTELEISTWMKLALISERARREPQCQFTSLAHLLDERFLAALLPPARQGPGQWHGWRDVEGVRRASGREPAGLGGPD